MLTVLAGPGPVAGTVLSTAIYDVFGSAGEATSLVNAINAADIAGNVIIVHTWDEPSGNAGPVRSLLRERYGAKKVYPTAYRDAYALVYQNGVGPLGECSSATIETSGSYAAQGNNALAWCGFSVTLFL
jgi:hypothetical protein